MYLKLNDVEMKCRGDERWGDLLKNLPDAGAGALGVMVQGRTCSLMDRVEEYVHARTLSFADEAGRRIYERSLQFMFLTAADDILPGQRVRIRHSFGKGLLIDLPGRKVTEALVQQLEAKMQALAAADLPIERLTVSKEDAEEYFAGTGQQDRLRILKYRKFPHFTLYRIDRLEDYFYGEMVPSTGYIKVFKLYAYGPGIILQQPDNRDPSRAAALKDMPMLLNTYSETANWNAILNCENAADLNEMIDKRQLREFIRVNEALQEGKIQRIAEAFKENGARLLLIAGPSSSGKTTFAHRMSIALRVLGMRPVKISLDDYYRNKEDLPREADGSIDLERIETLDIDLLCDHLERLLQGETVQVPEFDFKAGRRTERTHDFSVEPGQPIIIEGIHGLNEQLTATVPRNLKFKVYISALTMLNLDDHNRIRTTDARLLRRIVRDSQFRGTDPETTMNMWASVRRGEEKYIFPFQEVADMMFNSSLAYELPIMKKYAYPALQAIKPDSPHFSLANRLVKFLNYIETADVEDEIPVNSILREFIGGCCFYREQD